MIKALEGGRGLAALIVALYHLKVGTEYFSFVRNGYIFVDLFFVLSGFVICAAYFSKMNTAQDFKSFIVRRFGRLFPLLIFSTLAFILAANLIVFLKQIAFSTGYAHLLNTPGELEYLVPSVAEIVATLTLTHSLGVFDKLILNTPSWSISTEFYTYLLFAATCLMLGARYRLFAFAALVVFGFAVSIWASINVHDCLQLGGCMSLTYDFGFLRTFFSFFLGALVYYASSRAKFYSNAMQLTGMAALALSFAVIDMVPAIAFAFPFVFALLIWSVSRDDGLLATILNRRPFQILGQRSYSIYMMHMPLLLFFENIAKRADGLLANIVLVIVYVATLVIVSGWTFKYIEDPFRIWFNRLANEKSAFKTPPHTIQMRSAPEKDSVSSTSH